MVNKIKNVCIKTLILTVAFNLTFNQNFNYPKYVLHIEDNGESTVMKNIIKDN